MAARIEETSTITAKGQTTVPKAVRKALGVGYGGKITYRIEGERVTVLSAMQEHRDPALAAFLRLIENDLTNGRNIADLPRSLATVMRKAAKNIAVSLDEPLEGDVALYP